MTPVVSRLVNARSMAALALVTGIVFLISGCVSTMPDNDRAKPKLAARYNVRLGVAYMQQGRLDVALVKLKRAIKQDPALPAANTALARLYEKRDADKLAARYYRKALNLAPDNPGVQNAYGVFLCRHGHAEKAEQYFVSAANNADYATPEAAFTNAGICLLKVGEKQRAEVDFRHALKAAPTYQEALWQMAKLSFDGAKYMHARAFLRRFMTYNHSPGPAVLWLAARTENALGAASAARSFVKKLVSNYPNSHETALATGTGNK